MHPAEAEATASRLSGLLQDQLPTVQHAFAYGSAVFHQPGLYETHSTAVKPMLDFILAVQDPMAWHAENIRMNASHYSFLSRLGPAAVVATAERIGSGVYFNTLIPWAGNIIKYGVASLAGLQRDLASWDALYLAGRMQKPTLTLGPLHPAVAAAQEHNLQSAVRASLLLLPETFTLRELLHTVCGLSYAGDLRMGLAEDSKKVERIVEGSSEGLQQMYQAPLGLAEQAWGVVQQQQPGMSGTWAQDCSPAARATLFASLPAAVLSRLAATAGMSVQADSAAVGGALAQLPHQQQLLRHALASIVRASSARQAVAGLLSAGVVKSVRYAMQKLRKAWKR